MIIMIGEWMDATISAQIFQRKPQPRNAAQAASPTLSLMTRKISMASERVAAVTQAEVEYYVLKHKQKIVF